MTTFLAHFYTTIPFISISCGFVTFASSHKHLLNMLLSLEFIMLNIFWLMCIMLSHISQEIYLCLFFLTLVACEGALGLGLLVSLVRTHGNDYFNTFSFLKC
uniref:NADH-ubiquinone oxidoreductase chain 4L n=1 Tax=Corallianassa coutierei TaxID=1267413 RepID=L0E945_CORCW|nr:NADH dehydrogenase subunit 4L [Corallianassa coutierei]AGA56163.1 NADH dehydrogenase subunit 4L [Corallianassa coutierei]